MTLGHDRVRARVLEGFELRGRAAGVRGAPKMVASAKVRSPQRTCALVDTEQQGFGTLHLLHTHLTASACRRV